jgi:hypothetical protein
VDDFPAFGAYALVNGAGPYPLATLRPKKGSTASSLLGGANRSFKGIIAIKQLIAAFAKHTRGGGGSD